MKKESKFSKMFRRDEILRNNISIAGFAVFMTTTLLWPIKIGGELLNNEVTFKEVKYSIIMIGSNILMFLFTLFFLLIAKKKHFNKISVLVITAIGSIYCGARLYMDGLEPWGLFLLGWISITVFIFSVVRFLFKHISKSLPQ